jgi:hypothetical protein
MYCEPPAPNGKSVADALLMPVLWAPAMPMLAIRAKAINQTKFIVSRNRIEAINKHLLMW